MNINSKAGLLEPVLESLDVGKDIVFANEIREQSAYIEALMAADVKFSAKLEELEKLKSNKRPFFLFITTTDNRNSKSHNCSSQAFCILYIKRKLYHGCWSQKEK